MNWETILEKYGISAVVVLGMGLGMWKLLNMLANRHVKFLDDTTAQNEKTVNSMGEMAKRMGEMAVSVGQVIPEVKKVVDEVAAVKQDVKTVIIRTENVRIEPRKHVNDSNS